MNKEDENRQGLNPKWGVRIMVQDCHGGSGPSAHVAWRNRTQEYSAVDLRASTHAQRYCRANTINAEAVEAAAPSADYYDATYDLVRVVPAHMHEGRSAHSGKNMAVHGNILYPHG